MEELYSLLINIFKASWLFYALSLLLVYYACKGLSGQNSNLITLIVIVVFNTLMFGYQNVLEWYMDANPGISAVVNFFWYMGFAAFDLVAMRVIFSFHKKENVRIGGLGQYASFSFFAAGSLQLLQYLDIVLFKTDRHIDGLYTIGIPTINVAMAVVCLGVALQALASAYFNKNKQQG